MVFVFDIMWCIQFPRNVGNKNFPLFYKEVLSLVFQMYKFPVTCKYTDRICGTIAIYDSREMLNILKNCVKNCILYAKRSAGWEGQL